MTPPKRFIVGRDHPVTVTAGGTFAPGEDAVNVDPSDPHDAALIEEGRLFEPEVAPEKPKLSPAEKKAEELGVDLSQVEGTGKDKNVTVADVEKHFKDNEEESN